MNDQLRMLKEELDALLEENQLPQLTGDMIHEDLEELIETITNEEFAKASNPETIEQVRELISNIAMRVAYVCMFVEQSEADSTITVSGQELTTLFAALLSRGVTQIKVVATE